MNSATCLGTKYKFLLNSFDVAKDIHYLENANLGESKCFIVCSYNFDKLPRRKVMKNKLAIIITSMLP